MAKISKEEYELLKSSVFYWKWIAREEDGRLYKFHGKPKKVKSSRWNDRKQTWLGMSSDGFEFIQWGDENPYNVAKLIEEYEIENGMRYDVGKTKVVDIDTSKLAISNDFFYVKESEETKVRKNIEWLKGRFAGRKIFSPSNDREIGYNEAIDEFSKYVDQLEEKEKVEVPQFVFDWIGERKNTDFLEEIHYLESSLTSQEGYTREEHELYFWIKKNFDTFAKAWITYPNIEVEEEPLYRARLKVITGGFIASYLRTQSSGAADRLKALEIGSKYFHEDYRRLSEFTENELKRLDVWDSDQWEIEEVEENAEG